MKFTKVLSTVLVSATALSAFAGPATTFAQTQEHNKKANGGIELPQTDHSTVGISFGDNKPNGNTGWLRLQMVPHILDFGNHTVFDAAYPTFSADGKNISRDDNNRHPNYKNGDTNMTAVLNTEDEKLANVKGKAWATVVDKQTTRDNVDEKNTAVSGHWTLSVASDGPLVAKSNSGEALKETIDDSTLVFKDTSYGRTLNVHDLTKEDQDAKYAERDTKNDDDKDLTSFSKNLSLSLLQNRTEMTAVAHADDTEGQGADVFGWDTKNIQLTLPQTAKVSNAVYEAQLTWTLSTGVE